MTIAQHRIAKQQIRVMLRQARTSEPRIATLMRADAAAARLCDRADDVDGWMTELTSRIEAAKTAKAKTRLRALRSRLDAQWPVV